MLIVDRDEETRARVTALLRQNGFVVAAFRDQGAALSALAARPVDIVILSGESADGEDTLAAAQHMRRGRPDTRILFAGAADALPAAPGPGSGHAVTRPFDERRLLSAVFALLARTGDAAARRDEAEAGLMAARLACLASRQLGFPVGIGAARTRRTAKASNQPAPA